MSGRLPELRVLALHARGGGLLRQCWARGGVLPPRSVVHYGRPMLGRFGWRVGAASRLWRCASVGL